MSEENKSVEQQPTTQPADNGDQGGGKMFTQDEVNKIVSERLARDREKRATQQDDTKEQALKARESKLDCREYLNEKKYPAELLDILDTSDVEQFKAAVDKIQAIYGVNDNRAKFKNPPRFAASSNGGGSLAANDPIRNAFMLKT